MAAISTHLHKRPYQVATTTDPSLPHRKWNHHGTHHAPTHLSAAYDAVRELAAGDIVPAGDTVIDPTANQRTIFRFASGLFVSVGL